MGLGRVRRRSYKVQEAEEMRKSFLEEEEENSSVYESFFVCLFVSLTNKGTNKQTDKDTYTELVCVLLFVSSSVC